MKEIIIGSTINLKDYEINFVLPKELENSIKESTILITIMFANNETGVVHPIKELGRFANENNVIFMTDATQAVGKIPIDVSDCGVDILTFSAHKMYGPKGIGAIYVKENKKKYLTPQITGGGHENGLRSGTLNVPSIVGFGKASKIAKENKCDLTVNTCHIVASNRSIEEIVDGFNSTGPPSNNMRLK